MKYIFYTVLSIVFTSRAFISTAQTEVDSIPANWFNLDPVRDGVYGVATEKAYRYLEGREPEPVIVAILDTGVDIDHEDLKDRIWINEDEVPGNGVDDDENGYVDDVHGWNFIGGPDGDVNQDTHEITREYVRLKKKYGDLKKSEVEEKNRDEFEYWKEIEDVYLRWSSEAREEGEFYISLYNGAVFFDSLFRARWNTEEITPDDLYVDNEDDSLTSMGKGMLNFLFTATKGNMTMPEILNDLKQANDHYTDVLEYTYNTGFDPRPIVGDNYENLWERYYGNNHVEGPVGNHGTGVAGMVAAVRDNSIGINGIASNAVIMPVRVVPGGDERDKDVANGIRYAVDNGARVINMSFGKSYSPGKVAVDSAVAYAMKHGVILVHAAGNESDDRDVKERYPVARMENGITADNFLEVGASTWRVGDNLAATFSNYGKETVDIFAPGARVESTHPNDGYEFHDGTSLAAPVVSGVIALVWGYFPELSYSEVIDIIRESAEPVDVMVIRPGSEGETVSFSELSRTGGIVNAFNAVRLAQQRVAGK